MSAGAHRDVLKNALHWPPRANQLEPLESHLTKSSNLARALWLALSGDISDDKRDVAALSELAHAVADHASAAVFIFDLEALKTARKE
jgi:hypothetical protein